MPNFCEILAYLINKRSRPSEPILSLYVINIKWTKVAIKLADVFRNSVPLKFHYSHLNSRQLNAIPPNSKI